jgi:Glycosyl hydrolase family 1
MRCRANMESNVTLYWFVLPKWFMDMGGFEKEENIAEFVEWGRIAFELFGECASRLICRDCTQITVRAAGHCLVMVECGCTACEPGRHGGSRCPVPNEVLCLAQLDGAAEPTWHRVHTRSSRLHVSQS